MRNSFLEHVRKVVDEVVPKGIEISSIEFEGPLVVLYTKNMDAFASNSDIIRKLAQTLRRRVFIRPDQEIQMEPKEAEEIIRSMIPPEAQLTEIWFDEDTGEVTIEAMSPGMVIGKHGAVLNDIKKRIGWAPKVVRTPPIPSKTVHEIREYLRMVKDERKKWLRKVGKRINMRTDSQHTWTRTTAMGGYREVGRSATLLSTPNSKVLVDCGVKFSGGEDDSPYLNIPEFFPLDSIDAVVITHAHLDHTGLLPALFKYGYDGPVYCTAPTRDVMSLLQLDYIKVAFGEGKKAPYESSHIRDVVRNCITLSYGDTTDISPDVRLTFHNAGHILGSAIAHFHIGDGLYNIVFSGDIKYEKTWLFNAATDRFPRVETLVLEATYGSHNDFQPSRKDAMLHLQDTLARCLRRKGSALIPVFSVGRSQEVMIVIQQLMKDGRLPTVPVYLDGMIWEATAIHTAYPEFLNSNLRNIIFQRGENPFLSDIFNKVENSQMREDIITNNESCIVLATSGMLNGGPVMEYLREWISKENNLLVFVGYQAEGTLGRKLQKGMKEMQILEQDKVVNVPVRIDIETVDGFSGHSDRKQLMAYVHNLHPRPERIIINHGEEGKCLDLASSIYRKFGIETKVPYNLETIRVK